MCMPQADKRIPVREDTYHELGRFKEAGQTWDDLVGDLIETRQLMNRRALLERTDDDEYLLLDES